MKIQGKKVILRAIEESDIELLHKWANDSELQSVMGNIYFPSCEKWHKSWFEKQIGDMNNQRFAIDTTDNGLIGLSTLVNIDWRNRRAYHGIFLGEKDIRGKGYGQDAVMATMRYAFDELGFARLDGGFIEYNEASIKFYSKLGWDVEGVKENYYFHKGMFWKHFVAGITKEKYNTLTYWNE